MKQQQDNTAFESSFMADQCDKRQIAIFLHGFATSPTDLRMIADTFTELGFEIHTPFLAGHPISKKECETEAKLTMIELRESVLGIIKGIDSKNSDIYLIGFSLGGALAIDVAADIPLAGVLAINPFFEPTNPRLAHYLLKIAAFFPWLPRKRRFQTTLPQTREFLSHEVTSLPLQSTREVITKSGELGTRIELSKCPIIIVHSLNDKVAAFSASARIVTSAARFDIRLVPIHGLNHFMQFDISPYVLRDLALTHFEKIETKEKIDSTLFSAIHTEYHRESRHWSGIVFQIIVGFFTIFGALLAFTLPDVLTASWGETVGKAITKTLSVEVQVKQSIAVAGAPYYLVSYSFIIYLYLILLSLYFFYLNRIDTFIRIHIEPFYDILPWIQSRTRCEATGNTSRRMTNALSIPIVMIPWLAATALMIVIPILFSDRLFAWDSRNIFLNAFYFATMVMAFSSVSSLFALQHHTSKVTYGIPAPITTTLAIEKQISRLYASVLHGAYARNIMSPKKVKCQKDAKQ